MKDYSAFTLDEKCKLFRLVTPVLVKSDYTDGSVSNKSETEWDAVWDTGATNSCISENVVKALGLLPIAQAKMITANGLRCANIYYVDITLPNGLLISKVQALCVDLAKSSCDLLIGMDIIVLGDFSISNVDENTVFSFRTPSMETIDFVDMLEKKDDRESNATT